MIRYLSTIALAIAAALLTPHAQAEKVVIYREGQLVKPQDVAAVLNRTRSIRLLDEAPAEPDKVEAVAVVASADGTPPTAREEARPRAESKPRTAPPAEAAALSLPVRFAFDSAEILPAAREQLDALAQGIKLLSPERSVIVEGHTDAVGQDAYNLELSRSRARAVRDYLVQRHGIDASRLKTAAYGEARPLEGTDPNAAINRRVQFRGA